MRLDVVTIFPEYLEPLNVSLVGKARARGSLDRAEDAGQDAAVAAMERWPRDGVPDDPRAWLTVVARHRALDRLRREAKRAGKESTTPTPHRVRPGSTPRTRTPSPSHGRGRAPAVTRRAVPTAHSSPS